MPNHSCLPRFHNDWRCTRKERRSRPRSAPPPFQCSTARLPQRAAVRCCNSRKDGTEVGHTSINRRVPFITVKIFPRCGGIRVPSSVQESGDDGRQMTTNTAPSSDLRNERHALMETFQAHFAARCCSGCSLHRVSHDRISSTPTEIPGSLWQWQALLCGIDLPSVA